MLIVEDCEDCIPPLEIALEGSFHCAVHHSLDAEDALAALKSASTAPLALITDVNLPGGDGFELISAVRNEPAWASLPIVVVSATGDPQAPAKARARGADAFFSKPYSPAIVCQELERILHAKQNLPDDFGVPGDPAGAGRPKR